MTESNEFLGSEAELREAAARAGVKLEDFIPKDMYGLLKTMMATLANQAWVYMGLVMNPLERKITRDLTQARLAIDCLGALLEKAEPHLNDCEKSQIRGILAQLRMNFVEQSKS